MYIIENVNISGNRLNNFEIRVGNDGSDLGNNPICYKQWPAIPTGAMRIFQCTRPRYGVWVSVNKTNTAPDLELLSLREVRVYHFFGTYERLR